MICPGLVLPPCYLVNLRRRPDRRDRIAEILPPQLPAIFTSDWRGPFDGRDLTLPRLADEGYRLFPWRIESANPWWSRPLKYGEIGCTLSHLHCWKDIAHRKVPMAAILEDDAILVDGFLHQLIEGLTAASDRFDLLYLGRLPQEPDRGRDGEFAVPGYSHCTYGYLLTLRAAQLLLAADLENALIPVDEFLPAMYLDHPRADLRTRFPPRLRALAFDPPLVHQLPKHVAGSDTEDSDFVPEGIIPTKGAASATATPATSLPAIPTPVSTCLSLSPHTPEARPLSPPHPPRRSCADQRTHRLPQSR